MPSGVESGERVPFPVDYGVLGSVMSSILGSGAKPRSQVHFLHILGHRTLLVERKM